MTVVSPARSSARRGGGSGKRGVGAAEEGGRVMAMPSTSTVCRVSGTGEAAVGVSVNG